MTQSPPDLATGSRRAQPNLGRIFQPDIEEISQIVGSLALLDGQIYFSGIYIDRDIQDFRRILRYENATGQWTTCWTSVALNPSGGKMTKPKDILDTFFPDGPEEDQAKDKLTDALGVSLASEQALWAGRSVYNSLYMQPGNSSALVAALSSPLGCEVLTTDNGQQWTPCYAGRPADGALTLHQPLPFAGGWLALGTALGEKAPLLVQSPSLSAPDWQPVALPEEFGKQANTLICRAVLWQGAVYLGTRNQDRGFQIWKLAPGEDGQPAVVPVLDSGAYLFSENHQVAALVPFGTNLYFATGKISQQLRGHQVYDFELFRFYPDLSWDVIAGKPRFTPKGLKVPLAALGPGMASRGAVLECVLVHGGNLCVGLQSHGRFELWTSVDGETWQAVALSEQGVEPAGELVAALSTPLGLVLVFNPYGQISKGGQPLLPPVSLDVWRVRVG